MEEVATSVPKRRVWRLALYNESVVRKLSALRNEQLHTAHATL